MVSWEYALYFFFTKWLALIWIPFSRKGRWLILVDVNCVLLCSRLFLIRKRAQRPQHWYQVSIDDISIFIKLKLFEMRCWEHGLLLFAVFATGFTSYSFILVEYVIIKSGLWMLNEGCDWFYSFNSSFTILRRLWQYCNRLLQRCVSLLYLCKIWRYRKQFALHWQVVWWARKAIDCKWFK